MWWEVGAIIEARCQALEGKRRREKETGSAQANGLAGESGRLGFGQNLEKSCRLNLDGLWSRVESKSGLLLIPATTSALFPPSLLQAGAKA